MSRALLALALAFLLPAFSGCSDEFPRTTLVVDFGGGEVDEYRLPFDADGHPAASFYASYDAELPPFYNALDQLAMGRAKGLEFRVEHSDFGFFLETIDGRPGDGSAWWALSVNGAMSDVGMDGVELHAGDEVTWTLTPM